MTDKTTDLVEQLHELSERYPANRWYRESADTITRLQAALTTAESEARRFAEFYSVGSDGRNTLVILADKIAALSSVGGE